MGRILPVRGVHCWPSQFAALVDRLFLFERFTARTECTRMEVVSPTVFRHRGYRFYFFSREESRLHVHVSCADGEAKFWLTPDIALADNAGLSGHRLNEIIRILEEHRDGIVAAWREHFHR